MIAPKGTATIRGHVAGVGAHCSKSARPENLVLAILVVADDDVVGVYLPLLLTCIEATASHTDAQL